MGAGDVAERLIRHMGSRARIYALIRRPERAEAMRALGAVPVLADLDQRHTLKRIVGLADWVIHLAPPNGPLDARTRRLFANLAQARILPRRVVYISTSGVYGDHSGAWIDETARLSPSSARGAARVAAEQTVRGAGRRLGLRCCVLRVPGIYAHDRLPEERIRRGTPSIIETEDSYTNHIHADDLAMVTWLAAFRAAPQRAYNVCDLSAMKAGEYFDCVADHLQLPRPPRAARKDVMQQLSPMQASFLADSRRLLNQRLLRELRVRLRCPTVRDALVRHK